jgi:hypothetical protein
MTSSFTADGGSRSIAIVRRMKQLREALEHGQIGELTFLFEYGALERELKALSKSRATDGTVVVSGLRSLSRRPHTPQGTARARRDLGNPA